MRRTHLIQWPVQRIACPCGRRLRVDVGDERYIRLPILTAVEARVLGCLMEKKELTPDVYPLTLNALQAAANQKTSREPVMSLEPTDINRTLVALEQKGLVRRAFGSRVERYEQIAPAQKFSLTQAQSALVAMLMLRGPQTLNELQTRSERMANLAVRRRVRERTRPADRPPAAAGQGDRPRARPARGPLRASARRRRRGADGHSNIRRQPSRRLDRFCASAELERRVGKLEEQVAELQEQLRILIG